MMQRPARAHHRTGAGEDAAWHGARFVPHANPLIKLGDERIVAAGNALAKGGA